MYNSADVTWTLVAAFLVFFMQAGFALCEAGLTRAKNTGNILMKSMMTVIMVMMRIIIMMIIEKEKL